MLPKMILFDYGQTLFSQDEYNSLDGYTAVMEHITVNKEQITAEAMAALERKIYLQCSDIYGYKKKREWRVELPMKRILHYIMEYYGLESEKSCEELSIIYWDAACNAVPTNGCKSMLLYLQEKGFRIGIVSNLAYSKEALQRRLQKYLPEVNFEIILSSCDLIFRKPEAAIFDLAFAKSKLKPDEIWYCGDDSIWDVEGSYEVGMTPVWYRGALDYEQPIPTVPHIGVSDWNEFVALLERLQSREE